MRTIQRNVNDGIAAVMDEAADDLLRRSRDLAPQLTSEMVDTAATDKKDARRRGVFRRSVYYTVDYAVYQHEGTYNPGPVTRGKPGAGRKFLQRPFDAQKAELIVRISRSIERTLRLSVR
ncbi:MAG: hypothetical protein GY825_13250 [Phycisphaeraceae bacterium]|nr:hypothetical protein [Phycisphaeraceae bacterium]